jgi:anthranilate synthase component 2
MGAGALGVSMIFFTSDYFSFVEYNLLMDRKVLVVDNYDSFTWNLIHLIEQCEVPFDWCQNDSIPWERLSDYSHFLLSPGPGLPSESGQLMELIAAIESRRSILGVCLGFQAIAEHLGMRLLNLTEVRHGVSRRLLNMKGPLFKQIEELNVGLYHSWALDPDSLNDSIEVSSRCSDEVIMSFHHKEHPTYGIQFHPESILSDHGLQLIKNWLEVSKTFPVGQLDIR